MNAKSKNPKSPRSVKVGSVTVKIYSSHSYKYPTFTVTWRVGLQRHRLPVSLGRGRRLVEGQEGVAQLEMSEKVLRVELRRRAQRLNGGGRLRMSVGINTVT